MGLTLKEVAAHVIEGLRSGRVGKLAAAQLLQSAMPPEVKELSPANGIKMFFHCSLCLEQKPDGVSPADYARLSVGFTKEGLQVWCWRHGANVAHIHFEGQTHPCNTSRRAKLDEDNRSERGAGAIAGCDARMPT